MRSAAYCCVMIQFTHVCACWNLVITHSIFISMRACEERRHRLKRLRRPLQAEPVLKIRRLRPNRTEVRPKPKVVSLSLGVWHLLGVGLLGHEQIRFP